MTPSRRIGLTGGIATGKSSVARCLAAEHGLTVLDADRFARDALAPGTEATLEVLSRYGSAVRADPAPTNLPSIDRAALGRIVFADAKERSWLEQLVHPIVRARFSAALANWKDGPTVVLMIPLLYEAGLEPLCSEVWVVDCGGETEQLHRLMTRNQLTSLEAWARMGAQWPMATKVSRADVVIDNSGSPASLSDQVAAALASTKPKTVSVEPRSDASPDALDALPTV
ncbi:MAG: dephospho-CoA kinase [Cyanobacteriota bacterium]|nr:dephospho-CoA kinase [Cyanobacteriota bacterium]